MSRSDQPSYITGGQPVGKGEVDEGRLRGEEYDVRNFYMRSMDKHGNRDSTKVDSMKCPPFLNALVQKWVNDPRTPYNSASDFWRDAGAHRAHTLEMFEADPNFDWGFLGVAEKRARFAREAADMHQQTEAFQEDFNQAIGQGDFIWLEQLVEVGKEAVEKFREPYRSRVESVIKPYVDGRITLHKGGHGV